MSLLVKLFGTLLLVSSLSGCVIAIGHDHEDEDDWEHRQEKNARYISSLKLGQSLSVVESDLGAADFSEAFQRNGDNYRVLFFRTTRTEDDGLTTKDETTPLVFIEERLVGWGDTAIEKATL